MNTAYLETKGHSHQKTGAQHDGDKQGTHRALSGTSVPDHYLTLITLSGSLPHQTLALQSARSFLPQGDRQDTKWNQACGPTMWPVSFNRCHELSEHEQFPGTKTVLSS